MAQAARDINDVLIKDAKGEQPMMYAQSMDVHLHVLAFLKKQISLRDVVLKRARLRHAPEQSVPSDFVELSQRIVGAAASGDPSEDSMTSPTVSVDLVSNWAVLNKLPRIIVRESQVDYRPADGLAIDVMVAHLVVDQVDVEAREANVEINAKILPHHRSPLIIRGTSRLVNEASADRVALMDTDGEIRSQWFSNQPVLIQAQRLFWQHDAERFQARGLKLSHEGIEADIDMQGQLGFSDRLSALVRLEPLSMSELARLLPFEIPFSEQELIGQTVFNLEASRSGIQISNLRSSVEGSKVGGSLSIPFDQRAEDLRTHIELNISQLNLDHILSPQRAGYNLYGPLQVLSALDLDGELSIGALDFNQREYKMVRCDLTPDFTNVDMLSCYMRTKDNTIDTHVTLDWHDQAQTRAAIALDHQMSGAPLKRSLAGGSFDGLLAGTVAGTMHLKTYGNDHPSRLKHLSGQVKLDIDQGRLSGLDLHQVLAASIRANPIPGLGQSVSHIGQTLYPERWEDLVFPDARVEGTLINGVLETKEIHLRSAQGDRVSAKVKINLATQDYQIRAKTLMQSMRMYRGLSSLIWPIVCEGSLQTPNHTITDHCRADLRPLRDLVQSRLSSSN